MTMPLCPIISNVEKGRLVGGRSEIVGVACVGAQCALWARDGANSGYCALGHEAKMSNITLGLLSTIGNTLGALYEVICKSNEKLAEEYAELIKFKNNHAEMVNAAKQATQATEGKV